MAIPVQGVTVQWGTVALQEVTALEFDLTRGLPLNRGTTTPWTMTLGTIRAEAIANNALPTSEYGKRKVLTVQYKDNATPPQTQTLWQSDCIYEALTVQAPLNDVMRFAFTLRVMDTNGAGSYPP